MDTLEEAFDILINEVMPFYEDKFPFTLLDKEFKASGGFHYLINSVELGADGTVNLQMKPMPGSKVMLDSFER